MASDRGLDDTYSSLFDQVDPAVESLLAGLYKYKDEDERKLLFVFIKKLKDEFGSEAQLKDECTLLKYMHRIEDVGTIHNVLIDKDDLYDPQSGPRVTRLYTESDGKPAQQVLDTGRAVDIRLYGNDSMCMVCRRRKAVVKFQRCRHGLCNGCSRNSPGPRI